MSVCVCVSLIIFNRKLYDSASLAMIWRNATNSVIHCFLKSKNKKIHSGKKTTTKKPND